MGVNAHPFFPMACRHAYPRVTPALDRVRSPSGPGAREPHIANGVASEVRPPHKENRHKRTRRSRRDDSPCEAFPFMIHQSGTILIEKRLICFLILHTALQRRIRSSEASYEAKRGRSFQGGMASVPPWPQANDVKTRLAGGSPYHSPGRKFHSQSGTILFPRLGLAGLEPASQS